MDSSFTDISFVLLQMICVIVVIAYLITRTDSFTEILDKKFTWKNQAVLVFIFGIISIYGTESGIIILGAPVNVRDLGPMVAGLFCGPLVGAGAGLIGAAYRFSLGGFTAIPCSIATILAGLIGGAIFIYYRRSFISPANCVIFAVFMEAVHMGLVLLIARPFEQALALVELVAIPMMVANAAGMFIFAYIFANLNAERQTKAERDSYQQELERKRAELQIAREIQMSFLPEKIPKMAGLELAAMSLPAKEVGGDFYDAVELPGNRIGLVIADVSGKGVPAALFMALSRTVVRANALWHQRANEAIQDANTLIAEDSKSGMFVTLFYGVVDAGAKTMTYVNAGHNPPILLRQSGDIVELKATGIILGVMEEMEYEERTIGLESGDVLVFYTDGITEAIDSGERQFGEERLIATIRENRNLTSGEIINKVQAAVLAFCGSEPQFDDMTLIALKVA